MRFTKSVMAIAAICAAMLAMTSFARRRRMSGKKRRGMRRNRYS